jgi:cholesterol transport system auxiliary component
VSGIERPGPSRAVRRGVLRMAAAAGVVPVLGCGSLSNPAPRFEYFVIEDLRAGSVPPPGTPPRVERTLLMTTGPTQALYDSDRIVFTRDGDGRAYYQYSNWSERPARRILSLTEARLARGGGFRAVAQTLAGVRGDLVMSLRLDELIHDVSRPPGTVRTTLTAELVDWRTRALAARRTFSQSATVASADARGAARAANDAVTALIDELTVWAEQSAAAIRAS